MKIRNLVSTLVAVFLSMTLISVASAQSVSSTARGTISDANGAPIANATVVITHVPSGSIKSAITGANGYYFKPGLRVGGPYSVVVSADGYRGTEVDEIYFSQGTQPQMDLALEPASEAIEEIVVSATAIPVRDLNNGVGSAFTAEDIGNTPSGTRDVISTLLRDPLAHSNGEGHLSVGGVNPRFNGLAIDGSLQQDDFGLGSNTYATERSPINLDAVESASLVASDYDVTTAGFTGGLVNMTTKSGTNEWDGSVFYYWKDDSFYGDKFDGGTYDPGPVDETEYGLSIGGPIIKDKLFFYASYDEFEAASSVSFANSDADNGIEDGFFDALASVIEESTGYNPGGRPQSASTPETSERTLLKLDWNISDLHRAAFTYQKTEETGSSVGSREFESAWYDIPVDLESYTFQLFSDWNDKLSTTLRANSKDFERGQICRAGSGVGHVEVDDLNIADLVGTPLEGLLTEDGLDDVIGGCDRFRHANEFNDERTQILAKADYFTGDHVVSFGLEYEDFSLFNVYITDSLGTFIYDGYADLEAGTADVSYQNDTSNNSDNGASAWGYEKITYFVQDSWQVSPTFELGFGVRYETFDQSDKPAFDQSILDTYGVDSSSNLDGLDLVLPRISFRWDLADRMTLSGGFGLFSGGDPKVWTSNAFQLPVVRTSGTFTNTDPRMIPQTLLTNVSAGTPVPIDVIAPDFEVPSDWKASLRFEQQFDIGSSQDYTFTAMYLYSSPKDGFQWTNLAQLELSTGVAPDGRPIYADLNDLGIENVTQLGNFSEGDSHIIALGLAKRYDYGLDFNFSYAYQDVEAVTEGTSSRGVSNWRGIIGYDRNDPSAKTSPFQIEHSFKLAVGYEKEFFGDNLTRIDMFARRQSGDAYAHTFNTGSSNPLFGRAFFESPYDTDTLYVPTGPSDPAVVYGESFGTPFDQQGFFDYVKAHADGKGILKPFSSTASWSTAMDLRIQQEIPGLSFLGNSLGDNNFKIVLNIQNFLNLLNDDWGRWNDGPYYLDNDIVTADLVSAADVAANGVLAATALTGDAPRTTCLSQSDCVYRYNSFRDRDFNFPSYSKSVYQIRLGVSFDF